MAKILGLQSANRGFIVYKTNFTERVEGKRPPLTRGLAKIFDFCLGER